MTGEAPATARDQRAYLYLALMVVIGSSTATAAKFAVRELPIGVIPLVRFGGAGLCLLPLAWRGGGLGRLFRDDFPRLVAASAFCVPINQAFFLSGTRLAPTSHVGLIYAACPLIVLLLARALGQEPRIPGRLAGVLASVSGVAVIGLGNLWQGGQAGANALLGDLLLIGAVGSWGAYLTVNKPLLARHGAITVLAGTFLVGSLLDLPIAAALLGLGSGPRELGAISPAAWWGLAHLTLVVSLFGLACQNQALRRLDASQVATVGNAAPLLTVIWGIWLLGETVTPALILGGALTLGGILWSSRPRPRSVIEREAIPLPLPAGTLAGR